MKKAGKGCLIVIAVIVVLGIIGAIAGNKGSSGTPSQSGSQNTQTTTPALTPVVVNATALIAEYDKNKLAAQEKYTGKPVQTTGYIKNISNDVTGKYFLSLNPNNEQYYFGTTIACYFNEKGDLMSLTNGQSVTVVGTMQDMSLGLVNMKNCQLVK